MAGRVQVSLFALFIFFANLPLGAFSLKSAVWVCATPLRVRFVPLINTSFFLENICRTGREGRNPFRHQ